MKKLIIPVLASALLVGCGQADVEQESADSAQGSEQEVVQQTETPETPEAPEEIAFEKASLADLTTFATNTAFELYHMPGIHQLVDKEEGRTFLLVSLPHVSLDTSLKITDISKSEEGFVVALDYQEAEGENGSMFTEIYELSHTMDAFTAVDQNETFWGVSTVTNEDIVTVAAQYRVNPEFDQQLRLSTPVFDGGLAEGATSVDVTGYVLTDKPVTVSLVQGDQVISTGEFTGEANTWTPFSVSLALEGADPAGNLSLQFEGEDVQDTWVVQTAE